MSGLVETLARFESSKNMLEAQLKKTYEIQQDVESKGVKMSHIITTYQQGFRRGLNDMSRMKVAKAVE